MRLKTSGIDIPANGSPDPFSLQPRDGDLEAIHFTRSMVQKLKQAENLEGGRAFPDC